VKIAVAGAGYVGLSNAILLAQHNQVIIVDPDIEKVKKLEMGISPIIDIDISDYLLHHSLNLSVTSDTVNAYKDVDCVIIATPTDYCSKSNSIDTSTVEKVISSVLKINKAAKIVIKSTVPIGFTKRISESTGCSTILFSPEFLREGHALYDCLYPSRIIIGIPFDSNDLKELAQGIAALLLAGTKSECHPPVKFMGSSEAESVKLFSNTFLAMRISFFNELDSYTETMGLNTEDIIVGMGLDSRIGMYYNNPSFGYGGYCLPKDSKGLLASFNDIPQDLMSAIVKSNETRKNHIVFQIIKRSPKTVGIYRLVMKKDSDNFRASSIQDIMKKLYMHGVNIIIHEPIISNDQFDGFQVCNDFIEFANRSDIIIANRRSLELKAFADKVYTRDVFGKN